MSRQAHPKRLLLCSEVKVIAKVSKRKLLTSGTLCNVSPVDRWKMGIGDSRGEIPGKTNPLYVHFQHLLRSDVS